MRKTKKVHNHVDPLESPRSVQSKIQKINWDNVIPNYEQVKKSAIKYAKEAQAEAKRKSSGSVTSEKVMRDNLVFRCAWLF